MPASKPGLGAGTHDLIRDWQKRPGAVNRAPTHPDRDMTTDANRHKHIRDPPEHPGQFLRAPFSIEPTSTESHLPRIHHHLIHDKAASSEYRKRAAASRNPSESALGSQITTMHRTFSGRKTKRYLFAAGRPPIRDLSARELAPTITPSPATSKQRSPIPVTAATTTGSAAVLERSATSIPFQQRRGRRGNKPSTVDNWPIGAFALGNPLWRDNGKCEAGRWEVR